MSFGARDHNSANPSATEPIGWQTRRKSFGNERSRISARSRRLPSMPQAGSHAGSIGS